MTHLLMRSKPSCESTCDGGSEISLRARSPNRRQRRIQAYSKKEVVVTADELIKALVGQGWSRESAQLGIDARFSCEYCDRHLLGSIEDYDSWQIDHIDPVSKGGLEDSLENKAVCCKTCNFMKRNQKPEGSTREERIESVRQVIHRKRKRKQDELHAVLDAVRQWG